MYVIYTCAVLLFLLSIAIAWLTLKYRSFSKRLPKPIFRPRTHKPKPELWPEDAVTITWIGHSTVLMRIFDIYILTDPVFSERVGVRMAGVKIGPRRYTEPALHSNELPAIDLVLLSHAHMDHVDLQSLRQVVRPSTDVVTAGGTSRLLRRFNARSVHELHGTDVATFANGVSVTAVPVRHWGNRFPWNKGYAWTGYMIEYKGVRLFFAGDTAYVNTFKELPYRFGKIDVALLPIGAYAPDTFQGSHCTPEQAWEMFVDSGAKWLIPIHWDTFVLSEEPVDEPLQRLYLAAGEARSRIAVWQQGQEVTL